MFAGTFIHKLDDKGRLTLPAKFRDRLAGGMMVTLGQDRSLAVYPPHEFELLAERFDAAPTTDEGARAFQRKFMGSAELLTPDSQGRIVLSSKHRAYAGLSKNCVLLGNYKRVEIWDEQTWDEYDNRHEEDYSRANNPSLGSIL